MEEQLMLEGPHANWAVREWLGAETIRTGEAWRGRRSRLVTAFESVLRAWITHQNTGACLSA